MVIGISEKVRGRYLQKRVWINQTMCCNSIHKPEWQNLPVAILPNVSHPNNMSPGRPIWAQNQSIAYIHFSQLIGVYFTPKDLPSRFRHKNMIVYNLPEGILIISILSRFFMYFGRKFFRNRAYHSHDESAYTTRYMIFEEFSIKIHEKSRKNENYQNSFDKSINNHVYVPETEARIIWSDPDPD